MFININIIIAKAIGVSKFELQQSGADPAFWPRGLLDEIYITTRGSGGMLPWKIFQI